MAINTKFIQVHTDAIIEWVWDDNFYYADNYSIIKDIMNNTTSFTFSNDAQTTNYNKLPNQLYLIDAVINKYGIVDTSKSILQETKYINNQPAKYNKVKIWFPLSYNFNNNAGFYLNVYTYNYENAVKYDLTHFYIDLSNNVDFNKIVNETKPFRLNGRLWGKSIEIYIPEVYTEALNRINNTPESGTLNYRLTNGELGLSQTSPIYIDFRFLTNKSTILGETTFITSPPLTTSIPQTPDYNSLSVKVEHASDGDYFIINGLYNSSTSGLEDFMQMLVENGNRSYILYTITVYEENLPQDSRDVYVYKDFYKGINDYRPVFKFSNTTASIKVDMKLINTVDNSVIIKSSDYTLIGNEIAKYGKYITPINITGAIKPKLYNSLPDQLVLPPKELLNSHLRRNVPIQPEIKYVSYPILTNIYNVVAGDLSVKSGNTVYYGKDKLNIKLSPFDNVIKISISIKDTDNTIIPFEINNNNNIIQFVVKSDVDEIRVPLFLESNEVNLKDGVVVFKITQTQLTNIKRIINTNNRFYITTTSNGAETVLYSGHLSINDTKIIENNTAPTTIGSVAPAKTKVNTISYIAKKITK